MRTLTYRDNPPLFVGRITLVCLLVFSVMLLAHPCHGQAQEPPEAADAPDATEPAVTKPAAVPVKYDELPCKEILEKDRTTINKLLRTATPSPADLTTMQTYLQDYGLARWTVKAHEDKVRQYRQELRTNFRRIRSQQTYDQMNDLALRTLGDIAIGNYSPVARVNAMLAIGDLLVREPARTTDNPVALPSALPVMLAAYSAPDQLDAVRLASLLGILRHVSLGIADAQIRDSQVLPAMLALAKADQPPDGRSAEGHAWFRIRAMETLGVLGETGQQGEVANALGEVVSNEETPLEVRCAAARCLGQLDYSDPAGMDPGSFIAELTKLATAICTREVAALEKLKRAELIAGHKGKGTSTGMGAMMGGIGGGMPDPVEMMANMPDMEAMMGMMGDMPGMPKAGAKGAKTKKKEEEDTMETRRIKGSQRRLRDQMSSVLIGLGTNDKQDDGSRAGIHILVTDPDQETLLNKLTAAITTLFDALNDKEGLDSDALDDAIATASDEIGQLLAGTSTEAEGEQPPAEDPTAAAAASDNP